MTIDSIVVEAGGVVGVKIGGKAAQIIFTGAISPGLYQVNIAVPAGLPGGPQTISFVSSILVMPVDLRQETVYLQGERKCILLT